GCGLLREARTDSRSAARVRCGARGNDSRCRAPHEICSPVRSQGREDGAAVRFAVDEEAHYAGSASGTLAWLPGKPGRIQGCPEHKPGERAARAPGVMRLFKIISSPTQRTVEQAC